MLLVDFSLVLSLTSATIVSDTRSLNLAETEPDKSADQRGKFIAAFGWSVEIGRDYVWPFESMRPAPYAVVLMVVETMPRVWPERNPGKRSMSLPASRVLRVNGRALPRPHRVTGSQEEFRVPLENGRLRISFTVPSGFKLDRENAFIRVRLHKVD